jgi:2-polyprenyl-6-methoxyphenol hydroxylase-like FAD-dependent oxidoreductase
MILVGPALPGRDGVRHSLTPAEIPEATFRELANEAADRWSVPWRDAILDCIRRRAVIGTPVPEYVPDRLVNGRLALVGDAAHVPTPMTGSGFSTSLHDAESIAESIAGGVRGSFRSPKIRIPTVGAWAALRSLSSTRET